VRDKPPFCVPLYFEELHNQHRTPCTQASQQYEIPGHRYYRRKGFHNEIVLSIVRS